MKAAFALGLIASFTSLVAASPAADAAIQLEGRDPVICIGCVSGSCDQLSEGSGCGTSDDSGCTKWCYQTPPAGCVCHARLDNGEWGDGYNP